MLKERINYLSEIHGISRKDLVNGLITPTHLSNILAGRYPLPEDLASHLAERLFVDETYLLAAEDCSAETVNYAETIIEQFLLNAYDSTNIDQLPTEHPALLIELVSQLIRASVGLTRNDVSLQMSNEQYLAIYLPQFMDEEMPEVLKKALYIYKMSQYRNQHNQREALEMCRQLKKFNYTHSHVWINLLEFEVEALIYGGDAETSQELLKQAIGRCYYEGIYYHLTQLYMMYSVSFTNQNFWQKALYYLDKAKEYLEFTEEIAIMYSHGIASNRIQILMRQNEFEQAERAIDDLEKLLSGTDNAAYFQAQIMLNRCELAFRQSAFDALQEHVDTLNQIELSIEHQMVLSFYKSQLAFERKEEATFLKYADNCRLYFEQFYNRERLLLLYEQLAAVAKENRQYKQSSEYFEYVLQLIK